jgi:hypothetical protein
MCSFNAVDTTAIELETNRAVPLQSACSRVNCLVCSSIAVVSNAFKMHMHCNLQLDYSSIAVGVQPCELFGLQFCCNRVNCIETAPELQFAVGLQLKCGQSV